MAKKRTNTTAPTEPNTSKRAKVIPLSSSTTATLKAATSGRLALPGAAVAAVHAKIPEATAVRNSGEVQPRSNAELLIAIDEILGREDAVCPDIEEDGAGDLLRAPESALARVTTAAAITNWTVKNPGKVVPPTSNNYHTWTVLQLRRECTERNLRLPRSTPKTEQIKKLEAYDAACMSVQSTADEEYMIEPSLRKTKHCCIRLLNILFSDSFAARLASSDDAATRDQIDTGEVNQNTKFWKDVAHAFRSNLTDFNGLFVVDNPRFAGINPAYIVPHDAPRLYEMWKMVNSKYVKAYAKFYVSGQNSNEFYNFCEGNLDVVYLKACLQVKPELEEYVRGGMREENEIDSLGLCGGKTKRLTSNSSKWQDGLLKTVNRLADIVIGGGQSAAKMPPSEKPIPTSQDEDLLIDRIGKLHQLIDQVQERQRKTELGGHVDATLAVSLTLYQQRLQQYEERLAALE